MADRKKKRVFLYGAKQEVIQAVADRLSTEYPGIELAGYSHGYVKDKGDVAKQIAAAKPDMVFVALGYPHQEKFIYEHKHLFPQAIAIGIGGSFDVFSGKAVHPFKIQLDEHFRCSFHFSAEHVEAPTDADRNR